MKNGGYEGKIKNTGAQSVEAPFKHTNTAKPTVHRGTDLRVGK